MDVLAYPAKTRIYLIPFELPVNNSFNAGGTPMKTMIAICACSIVSLGLRIAPVALSSFGH